MVEPGAAFFSHSEGFALLDDAEDRQQIVAGNAFDRALSQGGQNVFFEDPEDLREGGLAPFLQARAAVGDPVVVDRLKGMLFLGLDFTQLLLTVFTRVDVLSQQLARFIAIFTCLFQADRRIAAEGHFDLLTRPVKTEQPSFFAVDRYHEAQAVKIAEGVGFICRSGVPNGHI
ncbi:hypothetical protein BLL37_09190 [Pseudomonas azotoformans]|uniref:Uncharacterized protein n=1 Tax=Pseudomonas azotoformans TaxID=47878 RepID=A0A1V2JPG4_PSEAZ|nr:hypothetical protein BFL39_18525 [Pseudomonas azotoformans]ONH47025.1 hypothetical protein BLL37_09190 [Pseudomonas azotoformans]